MSKNLRAIVMHGVPMNKVIRVTYSVSRDARFIQITNMNMTV